MANGHCPNTKEAEKQQKGKIFCEKAGRNVRIKNSVCVDESCSCKRK